MNSIVRKIDTILQHLSSGLIEKDTELRLGLLALIAGEDLLIFGKAGLGQANIARQLASVIDRCGFLSQLLTSDIVPEELFVENHQEICDGTDSNGFIAFLENTFNVSSSTLIALNSLLARRDSNQRPLLTAVASTSHLPSDESLVTLFDSFLLRCETSPVSRSDFSTFLQLARRKSSDLANDAKLKPEELAAFREEAASATVPEHVVQLLSELREWCNEQQIDVSDDRWSRVEKLLRVCAVTNGRTRVSTWDCWLLSYCLWNRPEERAKISNWYQDRVGPSAAKLPSRFETELGASEVQLKLMQSSESQEQDLYSRPMFLDSDGKKKPSSKERLQKMRDGSPLYLAPVTSWTQSNCGPQYRVSDRSRAGAGYTIPELDQLVVAPNQRFGLSEDRMPYLSNPSNWLASEVELRPCMEPTRHSVSDVQKKLRRLEELRNELDSWRNSIAHRNLSIHEKLLGHRWVPTDFSAPIAAACEQATQLLDSQLARLDLLRQGYQGLPQR